MLSPREGLSMRTMLQANPSPRSRPVSTPRESASANEGYAALPESAEEAVDKAGPARPALRRAKTVTIEKEVDNRWLSEGVVVFDNTQTREPQYVTEVHEVEEVQSDSDSDVPRAEKELGPLPFIEAGWFQATVAVVIVINMLSTVLQLNAHANGKGDLQAWFWPDQFCLLFYILELVLRILHYEKRLFCGAKMRFIVMNVLDTVVVIAGILDQWVMPLLPPAVRQSFGPTLTLFMLLRFFRVFKVVRAVMISDLKWTEEPNFQSFIGFAICINAVMISIETDHKWAGFAWIEQGLLCIYTFDLAVRLKHVGVTRFLSLANPDWFWNWLDFTIVSSSILDTWILPLAGLVLKSFGTHGKHEQKGMSFAQLMMLMRMLRLMRILRLVRLFKAVRPLYVLVMGVVDALQGVGWVLVLTGTVLYIAGILATRLIGHSLVTEDSIPDWARDPFLSVPTSMFTLFRIMSGCASDDETVALDALMKGMPTLKLCFVFFMVTSSWTLLSILTAVVSENMISSTRKADEEEQNVRYEESRKAAFDELISIFHQVDSDGSGDLAREDLERFVKDKGNSYSISHACGVPIRDVRDVLNYLHNQYEKDPPLEEFVDCLLEISRTATEKSILKIDARLQRIARRAQVSVTDALAQIEGMVNNFQYAAQDSFKEFMVHVEQGQARTENLLERIAKQMDVQQEFGVSNSEKQVQFAEESRSVWRRRQEQQEDISATLRSLAGSVAELAHGQTALEIHQSNLGESLEQQFRQILADVLKVDQAVDMNRDVKQSGQSRSERPKIFVAHKMEDVAKVGDASKGSPTTSSDRSIPAVDGLRLVAAAPQAELQSLRETGVE